MDHHWRYGFTIGVAMEGTSIVIPCILVMLANNIFLSRKISVAGISYTLVDTSQSTYRKSRIQTWDEIMELSQHLQVTRMTYKCKMA